MKNLILFFICILIFACKKSVVSERNETNLGPIITRADAKCIKKTPHYNVGVLASTFYDYKNFYIDLAPGQITNNIFYKSSTPILTSPNGTYSLIFQTDGNLVLYKSNNVPLWASNTQNTGNTLVLQVDGNMVIYNTNNQAVAASGTYNITYPYSQFYNAFLALQNDGNLVIYRRYYPPGYMLPESITFWASNTHGGVTSCLGMGE